MCMPSTAPAPANQHQRLQRSASYFERSIMDLVAELECGDDSPADSCGWQQQPIGSFERQPVGSYGRQPVSSFDQQPTGRFERHPIGSSDRHSGRAARPDVAMSATYGYAYADQPEVSVGGNQWSPGLAPFDVMGRQGASQDIIDILALMRER